MIGPTVAFGLFALLAVRYGAESRPYFDERPVVDDRPNWFPIRGSRRGDDDDEDDDDPQDGEPIPAAERRAGPRPTSAPGVRRGRGVSRRHGAARVREQRRDEPVRRVLGGLDVGLAAELAQRGARRRADRDEARARRASRRRRRGGSAPTRPR